MHRTQQEKSNFIYEEIADKFDRMTEHVTFSMVGGFDDRYDNDDDDDRDCKADDESHLNRIGQRRKHR